MHILKTWVLGLLLTAFTLGCGGEKKQVEDQGKKVSQSPSKPKALHKVR